MRINEGFPSGARVDQRHDVNPAHKPATSTRSASALPQDAGSDASVTESAWLVARLDETEDVRPELIEAVSRRLAAGAYDSRAAAEQTAESILQVSD